jgi:hypothetical protein
MSGVETALDASGFARKVLSALVTREWLLCVRRRTNSSAAPFRYCLLHLSEEIDVLVQVTLAGDGGAVRGRSGGWRQSRVRHPPNNPSQMF